VYVLSKLDGPEGHVIGVDIESPHGYRLDDHHLFEAHRPTLVCVSILKSKVMKVDTIGCLIELPLLHREWHRGVPIVN